MIKICWKEFFFIFLFEFLITFQLIININFFQQLLLTQLLKPVLHIV